MQLSRRQVLGAGGSLMVALAFAPAVKRAAERLRR